MRVALDATSLLDPHPTGVGVFTASILRHLADRADRDERDDPDDGARTGPGDPGPLELSAYAVSWRGRDRLAAVVPAGVTAIRRPMAARPLREAWRRIDLPPIEWWTGRVDVVHGTNFVVPPTRRAAAVVTVHDLTCLRFPELCPPAVLQYPDLIRRAVARGAWIHTVSEFVAQEVRDAFPVDAERVVAVPNGAPTVAAGDPGRGRRLAGGDRYVLFVGTIEPRKDLPLLVRAFDAVAAQDAEVRLVLAGADGWGADALTAAIDRAHHRDRIVRLGWVGDDRRADLLHGATVLAYPSVYEGFGLPPLEAMRAGIPVVTTDAGALAETTGDAARRVPTGDTDAFAAALADVIGDPATRDRLVERGHANVRRYSWAETAGALADLYTRAAGGGSGRRSE